MKQKPNNFKLVDDYTFRFNFGSSLVNLKLFTKAFEQYDKALASSDDSGVVRHVFLLAAKVGYPHKAAEYYQQLLRLAPDAEADEEVIQAKQDVVLLLQAGISDEEMFEVDGIARRVLSEFGAKVTGQRIWEDRWSGERCGVVKWLNVEGASVANMSWALAEYKAEADTEALRSGRYHIGFK